MNSALLELLSLYLSNKIVFAVLIYVTLKVISTKKPQVLVLLTKTAEGSLKERAIDTKISTTIN